MANQLPQVKDTGITGKCRRLCTGVFKVKADKVEVASNSLIFKIQENRKEWMGVPIMFYIVF
jgi:hypothetical protein